MRLIDADKLKDCLCEGCDYIGCDGSGKDSIAKCYSVYVVDEQPTAYDVEKVVEKLEEVKSYYWTTTSDLVIDDAIGIVKRGYADDV